MEMHEVRNRVRYALGGEMQFNGHDQHMIDLITKIAMTVCEAVNEGNTEPTLLVKRNEHAKKFPLVTYKKNGDVGLDLPSIILDADGNPSSVTVMPGEEATIPTGIFIELPDGYWAQIKPRSSSTKRRLLADGTIDTGYRGELFATVVNSSHEPQTFEHGDRIVQCIIHHAVYANIKEVDELSASERGESGFGSTGIKT